MDLEGQPSTAALPSGSAPPPVCEATVPLSKLLSGAGNFNYYVDVRTLQMSCSSHELQQCVPRAREFSFLEIRWVSGWVAGGVWV